MISQVGQQEQYKCPAVLFLSNRGSGRHRREEQEQRQLEVKRGAEKHHAKPGRIAEAGRARPADKRLPRREAEDEEYAEIGEPERIVLGPARQGQPLTSKDGT